MATVYRATDTRLGRDVALKVMHPHLAEGTQGADFIARFEREAQAAARLAHPGLVSVYDQGHDGRYAYLTMELVDGVTLRSLLDSGQDIDAATALGITQSIIEALTVAHSVGMVHRDIKPENVLVSTQGSVKLTDFGLARAVTDISSTATGTFFGTVAYIGPELVTHGHADSRTDLYAVGIMTYELLTGRQPFTAQTPVNIAFKHVNDPMPVLVSAKGEAFPAQINNFITSLTAKDPDERPADATEALALLRSTLANLAGEDPATYHRSALEQRDHLAALVTGTMTADTSSDLHTPASPAEASHTHVLSPMASSPATPPSPALSPPSAPTPEGSTQLISMDVNATRAFSTTPPRSQARATSPRSEKRSRRRSPLKTFVIALIAVVLLSGGAVGGTWWWNDHGPGSYTSVPQVAGMPEQDLDTLFDQHPLTYTVTEEHFDDVPKGDVAYSEPASGERVKKDTAITVFVSLGIKEVTVPADLTGIPEADSQALLTNAGFTNLTTERTFDTRTDKGTVLSVSVEEGSTLPHNVAITLTVSDGPEPITIPEVTGQPLKDAKKTLKDLELKLKENTAHSDAVAKGTIIDQKPASGESGYRGDTVTVTVSAGPKLITVPDVTGKKRDEAERILTDAGFTVETKEYLDGFFGLVRFQDVNAGEQIPKGSTVTITIF